MARRFANLLQSVITSAGPIFFWLAISLGFSLIAWRLYVGKAYYPPTIFQTRSPAGFVGRSFDLLPRSYLLAAPTSQGMWDYETECLMLRRSIGEGPYPNNEYKEKCGIVNILEAPCAYPQRFGPRPPVRILVTDSTKDGTNASLIQVKIENTDYAGKTFWIPARYLVGALEVK
jgi:hypothetical protein